MGLRLLNFEGALLRVLLLALSASIAAAAGAADKPQRQDLVLKGDAKCTR